MPPIYIYYIYAPLPRPKRAPSAKIQRSLYSLCFYWPSLYFPVFLLALAVFPCVSMYCSDHTEYSALMSDRWRPKWLVVRLRHHRKTRGKQWPHI